MYAELTSDQRDIAELFRTFFRRESSAAVVRAAEDVGHDPGLWAKVADTGAPGMAVSVELGGGGASVSDLAIVIEAWGAHLAPVPLVEHAVATRLIASVDPARGCLSDLVSGRQIATIALQPHDGRVARLVAAGAVADVVVSEEPGAVRITSGVPPTSRTHNTGDLPLADRDLTSGDLVAAQPSAWRTAMSEWRALMAVAHVGLAQQAIRLAVDYVSAREQFGVPVGSFQAIQHGLADAAGGVEGARLLAWRAIRAHDDGHPDADRLSSMALLFSTTAARQACDRSLQYHGGYGFAEEYDIQLYHRRATAWSLQLGAPGDEVARLADVELSPTVEPVATLLPAPTESFRSEVRDFLADVVTERMIEDTSDGTIHSRTLHAALAAKGWLLPPALGSDGFGLPALDFVVLCEELQIARAPIDGTVVSVIVGAIVREHGSDWLRDEVAAGFFNGASLGCFGYTEPESGSDVAAARTRAVQDGDTWVIDGAKMWTTLAHVADYVLLLTRTDLDAPAHRGLTFFLVPMDAAGVDVRPVQTMATERSNATFYDGVRIPDSHRVGEVNGGWDVMKTALKYERGLANGQFGSVPLIAAGLDWARTCQDSDGSLLIEDSAVRERFVHALIDVEVARCFAYETAAVAARGGMFGVEGTMTKLFASEVYKQHCRWFQDMLGTIGLVRHGEEAAHLNGRIEDGSRHAPVTTIYGGTSEMARNLIARQHLCLPLR